jgi:hypothetical protein
MKKIISLLSITFLISQSVYAADVICSLNVDDTRYKLTMESNEQAGEESIYVMVTSSSISATQRGEQSEGPVGAQSFKIVEGGEEFILNTPVAGGGFTRNEFDFTKITFFEESPEDLSLKIEGPALKAPLTFTNCLTAD